MGSQDHELVTCLSTVLGRDKVTRLSHRILKPLTAEPARNLGPLRARRWDGIDVGEQAILGVALACRVVVPISSELSRSGGSSSRISSRIALADSIS